MATAARRLDHAAQAGGAFVTVVLRPLRPGDAPDLVEVFVQAFQHGYTEVLPADVLATVAPDTVAGWFARWAASLSTIVAEVDGVPAGFVRYGDDDEEPDPTAGYVAALYVHPDASGAGIGRRLLDHAMDSLTDRGRTAVSLWVFRDNERARGLYDRAGFEPDGTEMVDPQWRVPQIRMRRSLPR
jgi:ribosomal protein S18 acetylase RimI-like enzyme